MAFFKKEGALQSAEKLVQKGRIEAAIKEYKKIVAKDAEDPTTLNRIGDLYARLSKNEDAVQYYLQTADRYGNDGFYVKAIAVLKKVHRIEPGHVEVHLRLADLYQCQGLINDARSHYQFVIDHFTRQGDSAATVGVYQKLVELEPKNPTHHLKLAELYRERGVLDRCLHEYELIAELMLEHTQVDQAVQVYRRAFDIDPSNIGFMKSAIQRIRDAGRPRAAAELLDAAVRCNPESEELRSLSSSVLPEAPVAPEPQEDFGTMTSPSEAASAHSAHPEQTLDPPSEPSVETAPPSQPDVELRVDPPEEVTPLEVTIDPAPDAAVPSAPMAVDMVVDDNSGEWELEIEDAPSSDAVLISEPLLEETAAGLESPSLEPPRVESPEVESPEVESSAEEAPAESFAADEPVAVDGVEQMHFATSDEDSGASSESVDPVSGLLAEAEVFVKYGLIEKAIDRLCEVLKTDPTHLSAQSRLIRLLVQKQAYERVPPLVSALSARADAQGEPEAWLSVKQSLVDSGFEFAGDELIALPGGVHLAAPTVDVSAAAEAAAQENPFDDAEDELADEPLGPLGAEALEPPRISDEAFTGDDPSINSGLYLVDEENGADPSSTQTPRPFSLGAEDDPELTALARGDEVSSEGPLELADANLLDDAGVVYDEGVGEALDLELMVDDEPLSESVSAESVEPTALSADEGATILISADELAARLDQQARGEIPAPSDVESYELEIEPDAADFPPEEAVLSEEPAIEESVPDAEEDLFDEDGGLFDLAAELQEELAEEGDDTKFVPSEPMEQSVEEIVEGFKRGVAENLSQEDADTHYNLGIAYREMMLLDEAIGEFQISARDDDYRVDSCAMLGLCFSEKGLHDLAVKSYRRALGAEGLGDDQRQGLLYDLAALYESNGNREAAYQTYVELYGLNTSYRDVARKLEEFEPAHQLT